MRTHKHTQPPKIPGLIYKGLSSNQESLLLFIFGCMSLIVFDFHSVKIFIPIILFILSFVTWKISPPKPKTVYISHSTVKADYGGGKVISDDLENYYLRIGTRKGRAITGYTYCVGLLPKENAKLGKRKLTKKISSQEHIPIRFGILTPVNVKEYVESFQRQISRPLDMVFESDNILEEYKSGQFIKQSMEK